MVAIHIKEKKLNMSGFLFLPVKWVKSPLQSGHVLAEMNRMDHFPFIPIDLPCHIPLRKPGCLHAGNCLIQNFHFLKGILHQSVTVGLTPQCQVIGWANSFPLHTLGACTQGVMRKAVDLGHNSLLQPLILDWRKISFTMILNMLSIYWFKEPQYISIWYWMG